MARCTQMLHWKKSSSDLLPNSKLTGTANLLVCPNLDSANIARNLLKVLGNGVTVGPLLLGLKKRRMLPLRQTRPAVFSTWRQLL